MHGCKLGGKLYTEKRVINGHVNSVPYVLRCEAERAWVGELVWEIQIHQLVWEGLRSRAGMPLEQTKPPKQPKQPKEAPM